MRRNLQKGTQEYLFLLGTGDGVTQLPGPLAVLRVQVSFVCCKGGKGNHGVSKIKQAIAKTPVRPGPWAQ